MNKTSPQLSVVMLGASGAVGGQALQALLAEPHIEQLTLLGRRAIPDISAHFVQQHKISIFDPASYENLLEGHKTAICTLGVGEPSKMSKEDFLKIDKIAVLDFAKACKEAGVAHFELLSSVDISAKSSSFYLRAKGELVEEITALNFERFSIFQPSMILTPTNRYGIAQAIVLKVWPVLKPVFQGKMRKYRGIPVEILGKAMALNILSDKAGEEVLQWDDFYEITEAKSSPQ